jgi:hypothetical protein
MKNLFLFLLLVVSLLLWGVASSKTLPSVKILAVGCSVGDGEKQCYINIDEQVTSDDQVSNICNTTSLPTQLRWYTRENDSTPNNGEEVFALAMLGYANKTSVRIGHSTNANECIGGIPKLNFLRLN